jgi:hypothetical protein
MSLLYTENYLFVLSIPEHCNILATSSKYYSNISNPEEPNRSLQQPSSSVRSSDTSGVGEGGHEWNKRAYLSDQKKPFDHLKPKAILRSTTRVVFVQLAGMVSTAISDQLHEDLERERKVRDGLLSPEEAEREYEEQDWVSLEKGMQCIQEFPNRCLTALLRFHATTLVMRWYEHMALSIFSIRMVDKLTKDPYLSAKRKYLRNDRDKIKSGKQMLSTALYSSAIAILSDITVQQAILTVGYALYYYRHRTSVKINQRKNKGHTNEVCAASVTNLGGGFLLKFIFDSSSLLVSRTIEWIASSVGASLGTMIFPGWGTVAVSQIFDGVVLSLYDVEIPA